MRVFNVLFLACALTLAVSGPVQARGGGGGRGRATVQAAQEAGTNQGKSAKGRHGKDGDGGSVRDEAGARDKVDRQPGTGAGASKGSGVRSNRPAQPSSKTVQQIRAQHLNFHAQPSARVATAQFQQHRVIHGSQNWHGLHYDVFRTYRPELHDRAWWHSRFAQIVLISGGWYYWNSGYWFPAWGYDPAAAYYPYDGPIYSGATATPVDQVIANVQSALRELGYYYGEIDGLLGPLTQSALASYQAAQGLQATSAIDQPTLKLLGLV